MDVYDELTNEPETAREAFTDLPDNREIVTVCGIGAKSATATELITDMGYDAKTLTDGMHGWSRVHRHDAVPAALDATLIQVARPGKGCLSYVLVSGGAAAVFDPSHYLEEYETILADLDADLVGVFDTQAHADHVSGGADLAARYGVPYYLHPGDALAIDATLPWYLQDERTVIVAFWAGGRT